MKRTALVALISTLLLTACGGDKPADNTTTPSTNNTTQTLRIATEGAFSRPF